MPEEDNKIGGGNFNNNVVFDAPSLGIPWRVLVFSIILFGITVVVFLGLQFGYIEFLENQSDTLDMKISELADSVNQEDQQEFVTFYSQLVNLKTVITDHRFGVNAFEFLEKYTIPTVYFSSADVNVSAGEVSLDGEAGTLEGLIEQLAIFGDAPELDGDAVVDSLVFSPAGTVSFSIHFTLSKTSFARL